jgi:hypothetical protein
MFFGIYKKYGSLFRIAQHVVTPSNRENAII